MKRNYSYHYTRYIQVNRKRQKICYQVPWEGRRMAMIGSFGSYVNGARYGYFVNHLPVKKARSMGIHIWRSLSNTLLALILS